MDQQGNSVGQHPYRGIYPPNHMPTPASGGPHSSVQSEGTDLSKHLFTYQQIHQQDQPQLRQQLQNFWLTQSQEIEKVNDFKNHSLPLARIKKIMKADGDVRMISAEAPVIFARACEMFILELTLRSWNHTEENRRRTLQKNDIAASISRTDIFDFLVDTVPKEDVKEDVLGAFPQETVPVIAQADALPYYYMQAAENTARETLPVGFVEWQWCDNGDACDGPECVRSAEPALHGSSYLATSVTSYATTSSATYAGSIAYATAASDN